MKQNVPVTKMIYVFADFGDWDQRFPKITIRTML